MNKSTACIDVIVSVSLLFEVFVSFSVLFTLTKFVIVPFVLSSQAIHNTADSLAGNAV